jgi:hypothetical protein
MSRSTNRGEKVEAEAAKAEALSVWDGIEISSQGGVDWGLGEGAGPEGVGEEGEGEGYRELFSSKALAVMEFILPVKVAGIQMRCRATRGTKENNTTHDDHHRAVTRASESNLRRQRE